MKRSVILRFVLSAAVTVLLFGANLFMGAVKFPWQDILAVLIGGSADDTIRFIVLESRLPQAITATIAGASLGVAGLLLQTVFRNPLAGPSILGISSGASLGVALVMLPMGAGAAVGLMGTYGNAAVIAGALAGSFAVMALLMVLASTIRNDLMLLITGMMAGYLTSSLVTLLSSLSSAHGVQSYVMWGMGTFGNVTMTAMPVFVSVSAVALAAACLMAKPLNILMLGDSYAANLGISIRLVRNSLLLVTGTLTAVITAWCGPISFIGMAMPHIARLMFRTDNHHTLLPATMLAGSASTLLCNAVSTLPENTIIPLNALTPIVGIPVILYIILRKR